MNSTLYTAINTMLTASGSSMEELIDFHFKATVKTEVKASPKAPAKMAWKPLKEGAKWGDLSEDEEEEDEEFPAIGSPAVKEPTPGSYLTVVSSSTVHVESDRKVTQEELTGFFTKATARKQSLPVVYSVAEFIEEIKMGHAPGKDFAIDDGAHCAHTYRGTLCENVRVCGKIHIQRCTRGDDCNSKRCTYLHAPDMEDEDAERMFRRTMRKYNLLKSSKQVRC
jgi:hypothetical protein